jgi:hypothetical protein
MRPPRVKRICAFLLALIVSGYSRVSFASEIACIDEVEYERISKAYADLSSKYDMLAVAQELYDLSMETKDLKQQVAACQKNLKESDQQACDELVRQYKTKQTRRDAVTVRFNAATDMQDYIATLKLKMDRPRCQK